MLTPKVLNDGIESILQTGSLVFDQVVQASRHVDRKPMIQPVHINRLKFKEIVRHYKWPSIFGNGPCSKDPNGPVMNTFTERLSRLKEQVSGLVQSHQQLQARLLEKENAARENQRMYDVLKERVNELERENEVLRKADRAAERSTNGPGTKERIDDLVAEIDRCLELLKPAER